MTMGVQVLLQGKTGQCAILQANKVCVARNELRVVVVFPPKINFTVLDVKIWPGQSAVLLGIFLHWGQVISSNLEAAQ